MSAPEGNPAIAGHTQGHLVFWFCCRPSIACAPQPGLQWCTRREFGGVPGRPGIGCNLFLQGLESQRCTLSPAGPAPHLFLHSQAQLAAQLADTQQPPLTSTSWSQTFEERRMGWQHKHLADWRMWLQVGPQHPCRISWEHQCTVEHVPLRVCTSVRPDLAQVALTTSKAPPCVCGALSAPSRRRCRIMQTAQDASVLMPACTPCSRCTTSGGF